VCIADGWEFMEIVQTFSLAEGLNIFGNHQAEDEAWCKVLLKLV